MTSLSFLSIWALHVAMTCIHARTALPDPVFRPPKITNPDRPQTLYYGPGERVIVKCNAEGTPKPQYAWWRNGKIIENDDQFISVDSVTGTLKIPDFSEWEEGVFVCVASNRKGNTDVVSISQPLTLRATRIGRFQDTSKQHDVNTTEYTYARMKCIGKGEVVGDPNDITYRWFTVNLAQEVSSDNGRLFISSDGTLHFTYTLLKDELEDSKAYHCGISSSQIRLVRLGPPMILNVEESTPIVQKPELMHSNSGHQALLGTSARLECVFSGYDPLSEDKLPVIKWFDPTGNPIVPNGCKYTLEDKNRTLRIDNVQQVDGNIYGCQGTNSAGSSRVHSVYLNVTSTREE